MKKEKVVPNEWGKMYFIGEYGVMLYGTKHQLNEVVGIVVYPFIEDTKATIRIS